MVIKPDIACGIMEAIGKIPPQENFCDFTVIVEGKKFGCHRFILNACSEFFKALLRSGMKETLDNTVTVNGITKESFALILKSLYKCEDVLTDENVIDMWHATNLLQISLLVSECEKYIIQHLLLPNRYASVYKHAKLLDSECVLRAIRQLMVKDFGSFSYSSSFLDLYPEDLQYLVESDDLNVPSEDVVVSAILKWVSHKPTDSENCPEVLEQWSVSKIEAKVETSVTEDTGAARENYGTMADGYTCPDSEEIAEGTGSKEKDCSDELGRGENLPNDLEKKCIVKEGEEFSKELSSEELLRKQEKGHMNASFIVTCEDRPKYLGKLLKASRICLVSPDCINTLMNDDFVLESREALGAVRQAVVFHLKSCPNWPSSAIHRAKSSVENVVVYMEGDFIKAFSPRRSKSFFICSLPEGSTGAVTLRVLNNQIFLVRHQSGGFYTMPFTLFVHIGPNTWSQILHNLNSWHTLIPHEGFMYLITGNKVFRVQHNQLWGLKAPQDVLCTLPFNVERNTPLASASFGKNIILFHGDPSSPGIKVFCIDTQVFKVTRLESLDGPVGKIVTFGDGDNIYIISSHGALLKVVINDDGGIDFQVMTKLWGFQWDLRGAIAYKKQLFLFGSTVVSTPRSDELMESNGLEPTRPSFSSSLPGYFDKIEVVNLNTRSECLPVILPKKWMVEKMTPAGFHYKS